MLQHAGGTTRAASFADVDVPTLVVAAEHDTFTPMALAEEMAARFPNAELEVVEEASHAAPVEQPESHRRADRGLPVFAAGAPPRAEL